MPKKKAPAKKPKNYPKLSQGEKFIEAAKMFEADETGETFDRTFKTIAKHRPKSEPATARRKPHDAKGDN